MPIEFLSDEQAVGYARFLGEPTREQLERFFWLNDADLARIGRRRRDATALGYAVQLGTVRFLGTFLADPLEVPWPAVVFVAGQLGIADPSCMKDYGSRPMTGHEHQWEICREYGYSDFGERVGDLRGFIEARAWLSNEGPRALFDRAVAWCVERKVLLPGLTTMTRLVSEVRAAAAERLWSSLYGIAGDRLRQRLDGLLVVPDNGRVSELERLRAGPARLSAAEMSRSLDRLSTVRELGTSALDVSTVPASRLAALARYGMVAHAPTLRQMTVTRRTATLLATVRHLETQVGDEVLDLFDLLYATKDDAYRGVAARLPANEPVTIEDGHVHVGKLIAQGEPASLVELRDLVDAMMPRVDLPELILEVHAWTGCLSAYTHISEANARMDDLALSVAACLVAEACNLGYTPVINRSHPALTRRRLSNVDQNYVRAETHRAANAYLIEHQASIELAQALGGGLVASVDGMRFVVPVATVNAGPNPRYFGRGRGITWLNIVNDQVLGIGAVVVPGTVRDGLFILDALLDIDGGPRPDQVVTDTASYSDQVFGLFRLLGYQFSPRLAGLPDQRWWRIDPSADYGPLNTVSRHRVNLNLIKDSWPDMLRLAGSLMAHKVRASVVMRVTQGDGRPTSLGRALGEYGRIAKTLHLLTWVDDPDYRRAVGVRLNVGEGRHSLARKMFFGQKGEIRQRYREGQEDQLSALGLVVNMVTLWNTKYQDAALRQLRASGYPVSDEDIARLSPLGYEHINFHGHYSFLAWCAKNRYPAPALPPSLERRTEHPDETRALAKAAIERQLSRRDIPLREKTLWRMLYETAARASEVLALDIDDLDLDGRRAKVTSKGGATEWVYWSSGTAHLLPRLLRGRNHGPVFLSERRPGPARRPPARDLCPDTGRARLGYDRARILFGRDTGWELHQLRHSAATHLGEQNVELQNIMAKTRHRNPRSAMRYIRPGAEAVAEVTELLDLGRGHR